MSLLRTSTSFPPLPICSGAIALLAAFAISTASGCGDARDEHNAQQKDNNKAGMSPERVEQHAQELQEPQRDNSVSDDSSDAAEMAQFAMIKLATADIQPTAGNEAFGTVHFRPSDDQRAMVVSVHITGLTPGMHGFHIHENGDCSAPDASSAGNHFNPYNTKHGAPNQMESHVGDLGNIEASAQGQLDVEIEVGHLAFSGPASILRKAVVIHAKPDDLSTDPSGQSGDRVGCGVIRHEPEVVAGTAWPTTD